LPEVRPEFISLLVCGLTASIGLDQVLFTLDYTCVQNFFHGFYYLKSGQIKKGDKVLITAAAGGTGLSKTVNSYFIFSLKVIQLIFFFEY